jgi:hypothetical protein
MKTGLIFLVSIAILASVGWQGVVSQEVTAAAEQKPSLTSAIGGLRGTWYAFPGGLMIRFNANGTADFGLDIDGKAVGFSANTWLEDTRLHITFTDYDGENEGCRSATGIYEVQSLDNNYLKFKVVHDDCQLRSNVLSGNADLGSELLYHPVRLMD